MCCSMCLSQRNYRDTTTHHGNDDGDAAKSVEVGCGGALSIGELVVHHADVEPRAGQYAYRPVTQLADDQIVHKLPRTFVFWELSGCGRPRTYEFGCAVGALVSLPVPPSQFWLMKKL